MQPTTTKHRNRGVKLLMASILLVIGLSGCLLDVDTPPHSTPPQQTSPPVTTESTEETAPPEPICGTVIAKELKIRTGVGDFHEQSGVLLRGDVVEILEETVVNGIPWGRISKGWICLTQVQLENQTPEDQSPSEDFNFNGAMKGTVIAEELNLRAGPGTKYEIVKKLKLGDSVIISEMNGTWGKTEYGWLNTVFAYFPDDLDSKTIKATVTADVLNVRIGPSTSYESLYKLENGAEVKIIKQVTIRNNLWGYIGDGWICMDYVDIQ